MTEEFEPYGGTLKSPQLADAEIELQHIELELLNDRSQHLRSFIDQYFCYSRGYVNRRGRAHWEGVMWKESVSVEAAKISDRKQVVKEHAVPIRVITSKLKALKPAGLLTTTRIAEVLDRYVRFATISKEEDLALRQLGLSSKMPSGFHEPGHADHDDVFSRYRVAGIALASKPLTSESES